MSEFRSRLIASALATRLLDTLLVGFSLPNRCVIGSSLDYQDLGRTHPYIGVLQPPDGPGSWP